MDNDNNNMQANILNSLNDMKTGNELPSSSAGDNFIPPDINQGNNNFIPPQVNGDNNFIEDTNNNSMNNMPKQEDIVELIVPTNQERGTKTVSNKGDSSSKSTIVMVIVIAVLLIGFIIALPYLPRLF